MAAVLHDVFEETPVMIGQLRGKGFPEPALAAIEALTKCPKPDAAVRAAVDPIARAVKLADNSENMDMSRSAAPMEKDFARLKEYGKVRELPCNAGA